MPQVHSNMADSRGSREQRKHSSSETLITAKLWWKLHRLQSALTPTHFPPLQLYLRIYAFLWSTNLYQMPITRSALVAAELQVVQDPGRHKTTEVTPYPWPLLCLSATQPGRFCLLSSSSQGIQAYHPFPSWNNSKQSAFTQKVKKVSISPSNSTPRWRWKKITKS